MLYLVDAQSALNGTFNFMTTPNLFASSGRTLAFSAALALAACGAKQAGPPQSAPAVGVIDVRPEQATLVVELPGRTVPHRIAEVRARVDGIVLERECNEGADVRAGQRLYQIDPAPYRAAYDSAKAALAKAQANQTSVALLAERYQTLVAERAVSRQDNDNAVAANLQARADVQASTAALETARINLSYTDVVAPIDGRIGKSLVTEGAYVRQGEGTAMATIQQFDPMYVDVTQASAEMLRLRRELDDGQLQSADRKGARATLVLEDGSILPQAGTLQFADITVDPLTGTISLRAIFPNKNLALLPGMFVHARIDEGVRANALLVPQQGVTFDSTGQPTALIVGADDKVELRHLKLDRALGNRWLVSDGLQPGDRIIIEGLQRIRPGVQVQATTVKTRVAAAGAAAGPTTLSTTH
jgi:membrane fusion protein, multidrug efflux system